VSALKVVAVLNNKGGVGKTTLTTNLGVAVALEGKRVLMIDADAQANLTFSFLPWTTWEKEYSTKTLLKFFDPLVNKTKEISSLKSFAIPLNIHGAKFDLISSHLNLMDVDMSLAINLGSSPKSKYAENYLTIYSYLRSAISAVQDEYDLVLIDCPPNFHIVTRNVFAASDCYLVPAKMDFLSTFGLKELTNTKGRQFVQEYNNYVQIMGPPAQAINPTIVGVVATMIELHQGEPILTERGFIGRLKIDGYPLFNTRIRANSKRYGPAPLNGIPVILSQDSDDVALAIKAELRNLSREFIEKAGI
jgi:chromosome partitioning protein